MKNAKTLVIQRQWCKGCGVCVALCPKEVLAIDAEDKAYPGSLENCIYCGLCELRCPDLAIEVQDARPEAAAKRGAGSGKDTAREAV